MLAIKDDEDMLNLMFAFMAKLDDEDGNSDDVNLDDLKQNVNVYSLKNWEN